MDKILLIIIAIFIPPLAAYLHENDCNKQVIINLILTIFGFWICGIIHALWLILR